MSESEEQQQQQGEQQGEEQEQAGAQAQDPAAGETGQGQDTPQQMEQQQYEEERVVPNFDPDRYVIIRDWSNENDCDIAAVFHYLRDKGVTVVEVVNPHAEALSHSFPNNDGISESFSPTSRAVNIGDKHFLAEYLVDVGSQPFTRVVQMEFEEQENGDFTASAENISPVAETWYIGRPAEIDMQGNHMEVGADSFRFPPAAVIHETVFTLYGLVRITEGPMVINGVTLSFTEDEDSLRSRLPGGFLWGKYSATIDSAQKARILGH